jgi:hypothetical protein
MAPWLISLVGMIYAYIGLESAWYRDWSMSIIYLCYSGANVGLWMQAVKGAGAH